MFRKLQAGKVYTIIMFRKLQAGTVHTIIMFRKLQAGTVYTIIVPRVQVKRRPSAAGFLPAATQMALCLRLAYIDF